MNLEKKFYNKYFVEITEQQANQTDDFYINYLQDGILKKIEDINSDFFMGHYYLNSNENLQSKIQDLCVLQNQRWVLHTKESDGFGYTLWNWIDVDNNGSTLFRGKQVLDSQNREIFNSSINTSDNLMLNATKKYYSDSSQFPLLEFEYDGQNNILFIKDKKDTWGLGGGWPMSKDELIILDSNLGLFPWGQHIYFHSAIPFLPNSTII